MTPKSANVWVGVPDRITGAIMVAPLGSPLPASVDDLIDSAFVDCGYISEDGLTLTPELSMTEIRDWGGDVVRRLVETFQNTLNWAFLETNENSTKAYWGDSNVEVVAATADTGEALAIKVNGNESPHKSWLFNIKDGDRRMRIVVPDGQIGEREAQTYTKSGAITYGVTLSTYPDEEGNNAYIYTEGAPGLEVPAGGADKGSASPGDSFPNEPTVSASDSTNAAKLAGLGYVADPATAWTSGQQISVNAFAFHWDGAAWVEGATP